MSRPVKVKSSSSVREAAQKMRNSDIGAVIVQDGDVPYGIMTDRDIALRAVAAGFDPATTPVGDLCSTELVTISLDDNLDRAVDVMKTRAIRRLLVVDSEKNAVGVISLGDVALVRDPHSVLGEISAAPPNR